MSLVRSLLSGVTGGALPRGAGTTSTTPAQPGKALADLVRHLSRPGLLLSLPVLVLLLTGFLAPLVLVVTYSVMPPHSFSITQVPTLANYAHILSSSYYVSFLWSLLLAFLTTVILMAVSWPIAYGMMRTFRHPMVLTLFLVLPLFISENVRLYGWVLTLLQHGVVDGSMRALFDISIPSVLYNGPMILLGLVVVFLPFMLFPMALGISMIPDACREAAYDMGANRWQVFREVEVPLAMPGILIGALLTFVLALGSIAESKILGGQSIIMVAQEIETAFTYAQNWPLGAALATLLIALTAVLVLTLLARLDIDRLFGRGD
ncbi:spermidine/putrescine transport system permease protein [Alkalispirillum mobile]|uniref:Spermidine/putrescine transport system permease protein n=1 Tax=Alkalispirillum mobile TaxID=85925 RepID=A0A498C811_9GAMM|nr:ABC transporter permease [Alkalispirillum mobile]RLK51563.1 spermidine/putrescine transport system permease protein [Alkalispirillum mobile]